MTCDKSSKIKVWQIVQVVVLVLNKIVTNRPYNFGTYIAPFCDISSRTNVICDKSSNNPRTHLHRAELSQTRGGWQAGEICRSARPAEPRLWSKPTSRLSDPGLASTCETAHWAWVDSGRVVDGEPPFCHLIFDRSTSDCCHISRKFLPCAVPHDWRQQECRSTNRGQATIRGKLYPFLPDTPAVKTGSAKTAYHLLLSCGFHVGKLCRGSRGLWHVDSAHFCMPHLSCGASMPRSSS